MKHSILATPFFSLIFFCGSASFADTYHRWVDDHGVTHYSKMKPADKESVEVHADSRSPLLSDTETSYSTEPTQTASDANAVIEQWCQHHRETLETLKNNSRVFQTDPDTGERTILNERQRAEMIKETEAQLDGCPL